MRRRSNCQFQPNAARESLETLSAQENERLWGEEAERRDAGWESAAGTARPAADVLRDARAKLK